MTTQTIAAPAQAWVFDPAHSAVEFSVKHMMFSTVRGRFNKFDVKVQDFNEETPERASIEVAVDIASVDTREEKRDAHLRTSDFFDVATYPTMTFKSRKITPRGRDLYDVTGDLTIRGISKEITLDAKATGVGNDPWGNRRAGIVAEGRLDRKDFGLRWNVALEAGGFLVGDEIRIFIEAELVRPNSH